MTYSLHCTTCDACISNFEKEEQTFEKNLREIEEISTLRKYLLQHVDGSEVNEVLQLFEWQLPLCPLCLELVNRIYDFENEIERIRSLMNYMVIVLKNKVLETFTSSDSSKACKDEKVVKLRSLIAGESGGKDRDPLTNFIVDDIDSLLSEVRTLHERLPEQEIKIEIPDLPLSPDQPSVNPLEEFTNNDEGLSDQGVTNNETADAGNDSWSNIERKNKESQNDDNTFGSFASMDRELSTKSRKKTTVDNVNIPNNSKPQETTKSRRKATKKLGNNFFQYDGCKFNQKKDGTYQCGTCPDVLKTRDSILAHIKRRHLGKKRTSSVEKERSGYDLRKTNRRRPDRDDEGPSARGVTNSVSDETECEWDEAADSANDGSCSDSELNQDHSLNNDNTFDSFASSDTDLSNKCRQKAAPDDDSNSKKPQDKIKSRLRSTKLGNNCFEYKGYLFSHVGDGNSKCSTCSGVFKRGSVIAHIKRLHIGPKLTGPGEVPVYKPQKEVKSRLLPKELGNNWFDYGGFKLFKQVDGSYQCGTCSVVKSRDTLLRHINKVHLSKADSLAPQQSKDEGFVDPNKKQVETEIHDPPSSPQQQPSTHLLDNNNSADDDEGLKPQQGDSDESETADPADGSWSENERKDNESESEDDSTSDSSESTGEGFGVNRRRATSPDDVPSYIPPNSTRDKVRSKKLGINCFEYKGHKFSHVEDGNSKCSTCSGVFKRGSVVAHINRVHVVPRGEGLNYKPQERVQSRQTVKRLGSGCYEYDGYKFRKQADGTYKCGVCLDVIKTSRQSIVIHIKKLHLNGKTERRHWNITKIGDNSYEVLGHKFSQESDSWKCGTCPKAFETKDRVVGHIKRKHMDLDGSEPILCPVCGKSFVSQISYISHSSIHTGEKNHMCDVCGRTFRLLRVLEVHQRMHEGERGLRYKCGYEDCDKKFLRSNELIQHVRRIHTGERPYICEMCGKSYVSGSSLKWHMSAHAEERKFSCDLCAANFKGKNHLKRHKIQVHKMDPKQLKL